MDNDPALPSLDSLIENEKVFFTYSLPHCSYPSQDVIGTACCDKKCVYYMKRVDILVARFHYVRFANLVKMGKKQLRALFIQMISHRSDDSIVISPFGLDVEMCPTLLCRVFGLSTNIFFDCLADPETPNISSRPWYEKTVEILSTAMLNLSRSVQFNSLNQLMLPSNFSFWSRCKRTGSKSADRDDPETDELTNSSTKSRHTNSMCVLHKPQRADKEEWKEAETQLKSHFLAISQQRSIIDCLAKQSRETDFDLSLCLMDAMSNRFTKLPLLVTRPKSISDSSRVILSLTTVQLSEYFGDLKFTNIEFPVFQGLFQHSSSFNVSLFLDALKRSSSIGSTVYLVMDSAANNKSFVFIGAIGYLLTQLDNVQKISLLYASVGHTHLSVDSHFGVISKELRSHDIKDPKDLIDFLKNQNSVAHVSQSPTIYNFAGITDYMYTPSGLCSNGVINIFKDNNGRVLYSSSLTMNAMELVGAETGTESKNLFQDAFYVSSFFPEILKPSTEQLSTQIASLFKLAPILFSKDNEKHYYDCLNKVGKKSFLETISEINDVPRKHPIVNDTDNPDCQMSVLRYLQGQGVGVGRMPRTPDFQEDQLSRRSQ